MLMRQVEVAREREVTYYPEPPGEPYQMTVTEARVCWVEARPGLEPGRLVEFKGEDPPFWRINAVYNTAPVPREQLNRGWKVGGLA